MPAVCLKTNFSVNLNRVESWKWPNGLCLRSTCPASAMIKCPPLLKAQTCIMQINLGPQSIMNHSCFSGEGGGVENGGLGKEKSSGRSKCSLHHCLFLTDALTKCCCIYLNHVVILSTLKLDSGLGLTAREGCSFLKKRAVCAHCTTLHTYRPILEVIPPQPFFWVAVIVVVETLVVLTRETPACP